MKDLGRDFSTNESDISQNCENKDCIGGVINDDKSSEDLKKSVQANKEEPDYEKKDNGREAKNDFEKTETTCEKEKNDKGKGEDSETVEQPQYSSCYQPPYYVPNFTAIGADAHQATRKNTNQRKKGIVIAAIIAASILLTIALFVGAFSVTILFREMFSKSGIDMDGEQLPIIQNFPQMNITTNTDAAYEPQSLPEVVSKVGNSVVEIRTSSTEYFGQYVTSGAGSGVIVTQSGEAGYLLTNYHVIYGDDNSLADTVTVVLTNGEEYVAQLVGSDSSLDLAALRIVKKSNEEFTVASFGSSSKLVVGQEVIAIGNPLGSLGGTVTDGIISALDRRVRVGETEMVLLQHNAAINPGNSGGGLFDMVGNLIGIVNAKSSDIGIEGLGFAIPSDIALNFLNRIMVLEPAIGIRVKYGLLHGVKGVYVVETINTDFKIYDRIVSVNGDEIESAADYYAILDTLKIGDVATVKIKRNGTEHTVKVTLQS